MTALSCHTAPQMQHESVAEPTRLGLLRIISKGSSGWRSSCVTPVSSQKGLETGQVCSHSSSAFQNWTPGEPSQPLGFKTRRLCCRMDEICSTVAGHRHPPLLHECHLRKARHKPRSFMFLLLDKIFQRCLHGVAVARSAPQEINPPYLTAVNLVYLLASTSVISCITKPIL